MPPLKKQVTKNRSHCKCHHFESKVEIDSLRANLLEWYNKSCRTLPWRSIAKSETDLDRRGYAVWVSEIMLQQTQVATVMDYYKKWMERWPTVQELSKASLEEINQMWSGLGYYSRGKRLWEGAKKVVESFDGVMPRTSAALEKELPGVGRYTAAAIASIAYGEPVGVVDGNVVRVIARMRRIGADSNSNDVLDSIWSNAEKLVDPDHPGDFNQAMMELGATVCTPKQPACEKCPVSGQCLALLRVQNENEDRKNKLVQNSAVKDIEECCSDCDLCFDTSSNYKVEDGVTNFPRKSKKNPPRQEISVVIIVSTGDKFCLLQRPETGLLANLLEFPSQNVTGKEPVEIKKKFVQMILEDQFQLKPTDLNELGEVVHQFSHIHQTYKVFSAKVESPTITFNQNQYQKCEWLMSEEIDQSAISTAMKKVFGLLKKQSRGSKRPSDIPIPSSQKKIRDFFVKKNVPN